MQQIEDPHTNRRVVVTGIGIICPIGIGADEFWQNCLMGSTNLEKIPDHWHDYHSFKSTIWSPLPKPNFQDHDITPIDALRLDPATQLAIASSSMALKNAGIDKVLACIKNCKFKLVGIDPTRTGVIFGTGVGGVTSLLAAHAHQAIFHNKKNLNRIIGSTDKEWVNGSIREKLSDIQRKLKTPRRYNPFIVSMIMPNACASNLSIKYGIKGISNTVCAACASGTAALGHAYRSIKTGLLDIAVTGGVEYLKDDYGSIFRGFDTIGALTRNPDATNGGCRPFDSNRDGFLFSEGASATLILEDRHHAKSRGAQILGEIIGFAESSDADNIMIIEQEGEQIKRMLTTVLDETGLCADDIDYINTHGTGTAVNDEAEAKVINELFGNSPLINSTKSLLGHTIGASGAIEAIVCLLSIMNNKTHICKNLEAPIMDLNFVTEVKDQQINTAISQSFGFGGHNCAIAIRGVDV
jgi:3-oxoacyl-[acyl-carrier-protein] synthase II